MGNQMKVNDYLRIKIKNLEKKNLIFIANTMKFNAAFFWIIKKSPNHNPLKSQTVA